MAEDYVIQVENVKRRYILGGESLWALNGVTLDIRRHEFISIMGPSGSGKSTLFNQIGALDQPTEGKVWFEGRSLFELSEPEQAWVRCNKIGYMFQTFNLIHVMSALQNVMLPMTFQGASKAEAAKRATAILERVGLGHRLHHRPSELSGGQQQRCAIARALANEPEVILADEPTGNLDTKTGTDVIALIKSLNREKGVTVICSTHDSKVLAASDRVCWIRDGRIERIADSTTFKVEEMARDSSGREA